MGRIVAELRRRHVFRTLALYILGAWVLMQVADVLLPALSLPESSIRYLVLAAIAGFPLALVFGWFFDITAGGIRRTPATDPDLIEVQPLQGFDYALLLALVAVLALIGYGLSDAVLDLPEDSAASVEAEAQPSTGGPPMVGVLPFAHLGSGDDGDFFASGIHDDLLTRLAKLQGMRVVSRTSVMGYVGTTKKIPEIGRELRADAILEGGVRVAGDQIRINAQLIDARSDEHLWAETYDRRLTASNIFEVQSEIARAIAAALRTTLTPEDSAELALIPTDNLAAYRAYHEIMQWRETVTLSINSDNEERYLNGLRRAFELDPRFTRPMLDLVLQLSSKIYFGEGEGLLPEIQALIEGIGEVAPNSADYYAAQAGYFYYVLRDFERAEALVAEAQKRAPSDPRLVQIESWIKRRQGDFEGFLDASRRARDLDPRSTRQSSVYINRLVLMHRYEQAWQELEALDQAHESFGRTRCLLMLREHHDPVRYARELRELLEPLEEERRVQRLFLLGDAQLAARDFAALEKTADQMLSIINANERPSGGAPGDRIPFDLYLKLFLAMLIDDEARTGEMVVEIKRATGLEGRPPAELPKRMRPMDRATLALAEGEHDLVIAWMSAQWRDPPGDYAEWLNRAEACQMLGEVGADEEAVACLRNVFEEPSNAHPFLEPLFPFYDPLRDKPAFQGLVAELVNEGWLAPGQATP